MALQGLTRSFDILSSYVSAKYRSGRYECPPSSSSYGNMAVTSSYRNFALFTRYSTLWKFPFLLLLLLLFSDRKIDFSNGQDQCRFRTKSLKDSDIPFPSDPLANRRIPRFLPRERVIYIGLFNLVAISRSLIVVTKF